MARPPRGAMPAAPAGTAEVVVAVPLLAAVVAARVVVATLVVWVTTTVVLGEAVVEAVAVSVSKGRVAEPLAEVGMLTEAEAEETVDATEEAAELEAPPAAAAAQSLSEAGRTSSKESSAV